MNKILLFIFVFLVAITPCKSLTVTSEAAILIDEDSGRILFSKNSEKEKLIASITKIMTAVIAIESNKLDDNVVIDESILKAYGSNIYIQIGETMKLRDLVYGLMLRSGNDAALAISSYLSSSGQDFVTKMNEKAKEIGMKRTTFVNPHGLDEDGGNISTAYDMAILTNYANKLEEYKIIVGTRKKTVKTDYKTYVWYNKNKLLTMYKWATGGKTGFTEKARRTLVSSATKNNLNLVVVTLNDPDDWNSHQKLYEYGFNNYRNYQVLNKATFEINSDVIKHKLYIKSDYYFPLHSTETDDIHIKAKLVRSKRYANKDKVGTVEVYFKDMLVHVEDILVEVKPRVKVLNKSLWQKIRDWFKL